MGDERKSHRKPVSLNDRHYRFLQDLSAPPKPSVSLGKVDDNGNKYQAQPLFSIGKAIIDSSYYEEEEFQAQPHFSTDDVKEEFQAKHFTSRVDDNEDKFQAQPRFPKEEKEAKMKIEGRRRLCKVSQDAVYEQATAIVPNEPTFAGILDFDSPVQTEPQGTNPGVGEIRNILDDLTSRLDFLSIEKEKKAPRSSSFRAHDLLELPVNVTKYENAESSFLHMSGPSSGSVKNEENAVDGNGEQTDSMSIGLKKNDDETYFVSDDMNSVSEDDVSLPRVERTKKSVVQPWSKKEAEKVHERLRSNGRLFVPVLRDESEEGEDDCVVLSGKKTVKEAVTQCGKYKKSPHDSDLSHDSDDNADESVSVDEGSIILTGPKSTYKLPGTIATMLFPHQREGLKWFWSLHCQGKGGILGDDMGLGKTMQICSFLAGMFHSKLIKRALVVVPTTLIPHWIKELSVVGLSSLTREYFGKSKAARKYELQYILQDKGVVLTTYGIVTNDAKLLQGVGYFGDEESEDSFCWDYLILDEGHLVKNPSTDRAKSLLQLPSAHRIVISGTPLQNNLKELWALFNFCCPDLLGDSKHFKNKYECPILRGNEKKASDRDKRIGSAVAKELRERIQPYFLRRLKNEVFKENDSATSKLSRKNELIVWLRLTKCQRQLYEAFLQSELVLSSFDGSPLAALTIMKKICDHPLLLTKRAAEDLLEGMDSMLNPEEAGVAEKIAMHLADISEVADFQEKHDSISCKISFIMSLLNNLIPEGHNVLIFSQTRKMLNLIEESLISNGYKFLRIDGTTKLIDRVKIVDDFQDGSVAPIFLLTSQVGGLGLTLTKADRVIVVDPAWNPSTDNQSVDRAYRIGQKKDVIVYRLMTCGTVEEKIYRKQIYKGGLFRSATEHKEQTRYFSQQDLQELFSLPKQGFDVSLTQQQLHEEHDSQHKMDVFLETHLKFLETQGIAGVSHHNLLFSKTEPVEVGDEDKEEIRRRATSVAGNSSSSYQIERDVEGGAVHAFNPKDVKHRQKSSSPGNVPKLTESEIKERINRLSSILGNKATVSRLPDKGDKLQNQILELKSELERIRTEHMAEKEVVDVEHLTGELGRRLNV